MSDENKLLLDANRGARAKLLIESDLFKEAFASLEESYIAAWRSTKIDDASSREKLFLAINVLGKVQQHLTTALNDGKIAEAELRDLAQAAERQKPWQGIRT